MSHPFLKITKESLFRPTDFDFKSYQNTPHLLWRWLYIFLAWLSISILLGYYGELLIPVVPDQTFYREFVMAAVQILFQTVIVGHLTQKRLVPYLCQMMSVSLIGSFLLLPPLLFAHLLSFNAPSLFVAYFLVIVGVIIWIHKIRVEQLGLHWIITLSWIFYRLLLLGVIYGVGPL
jgi:hypothetical protein